MNKELDYLFLSPDIIEGLPQAHEDSSRPGFSLGLAYQGGEFETGALGGLKLINQLVKTPQGKIGRVIQTKGPDCVVEVGNKNNTYPMTKVTIMPIKN